MKKLIVISALLVAGAMMFAADTKAASTDTKAAATTTTAARQGGLYVSSNVWIAAGAKYYGDGSQLQNVTTNDNSKVLKAGDTMTGQLTLLGSTLTVTGDGFSVTGSTFSILGGSVAVGGRPDGSGIVMGIHVAPPSSIMPGLA